MSKEFMKYYKHLSYLTFLKREERFDTIKLKVFQLIWIY